MILCGPGKNLAPFSKTRSTGITKPLLPIANKPMIEYVLDWCSDAVFPKVTLLCDEQSVDELTQAVEKYKKRNAVVREGGDSDSTSAPSTNKTSRLQFDSIGVVGANLASSGEVFSYLHRSNTIAPLEHFVLLPCDFITNLPPQVLIEAYRSRQDSDIGVLCYYKNQLDIEDRKNKIFPKNYTVFADLPTGQSQLLDYYSTEDVDFHKALKIRTQLTWNFPNTTVATRFLNTSIFFGCAKGISRVLEENSHKFTESYFASRPMIKVIRDLARFSWQKANHDTSIGFVLVPTQAQFIRSCNLPVLLEANRYYLKAQFLANSTKNNSASSKEPKGKSAATVGVDAIIGENTVLGEKTNVKRTVVGNNCTIGKRVKLTGSVILDNVVLEDDIALENCIVGHDVVIHSKVKLVSCNVESTLEVAKGTQAKGDTLNCMSLEGLVDGDDDEDEVAIESLDDELSTGSDYDYNEDIDYDDNADGLFGY